MKEIYKETQKHKYHGSYLGRKNDITVKQTENIIITKESRSFDDGWWKETDEVYKRGPKKGQHKKRFYLHYYPKLEYTENQKPALYKVWKSVPEYPIVSYKFSYTERANLIVDIDDKVASIKAAKDIIDKLKPSRLPEPSYIIRNPLSGHFQFGWFTTITKNETKFNQTIKALANIFKSDEAFNGPACKNPYSSQLETKVYNENMLDFEVLSDIILYKYIPSLSLSIDNTHGTITKKIQNYSVTKQAKKKQAKEQSTKDSRNYYILTYLREAIWTFMRNNEDKRPSKDWIKSTASRLNEEAAKYTGKSQTLDNTEVENIIKSCTKWSFSHYKDNYVEENKHIELCDKARNVSKMIRKVEMLINYVAWKNGDLIVPKSTKSRYSHFTENDIMEMWATSLEFKSYYEQLNENNDEIFNSDWSILYDKITDKCIYNILFSSFSIDNTDGTYESDNLIIEPKSYDTPVTITNEKKDYAMEYLKYKRICRETNEKPLDYEIWLRKVC